MKGKETDHLFLKTQHEKASGISRNCAHKLKLWQLMTCDLHIPSSSSDSWGPFSIRLGSFRQLLYCLIMHNWSFQMTTEAVTKAHGSSCNIMQNVLLTAKKISDEIMGVKGLKITIVHLSYLSNKLCKALNNNDLGSWGKPSSQHPWHDSIKNNLKKKLTK